MADILPIDSSDKDYEITIALDGVDYVFRIRWRARLAGWFMDIFDAEKNPLLSGQRIATNAGLNRAIKHIIQGNLIAISMDDQDDSDPGEDDLGVRVLIIYDPV